jgi:hypothetical protein
MAHLAQDQRLLSNAHVASIVREEGGGGNHEHVIGFAAPRSLRD